MQTTAIVKKTKSLQLNAAGGKVCGRRWEAASVLRLKLRPVVEHLAVEVDGQKRARRVFLAGGNVDEQRSLAGSHLFLKVMKAGIREGGEELRPEL
jgi:hypothetical protein